MIPTVLIILLLHEGTGLPVQPQAFEQDILGMELDEMDDSNRKAMLSDASNNERARWPNGTVPFEISDHFTPDQQSRILRAISDFHQLTCVKFVPHTSERDFIRIVTSPVGCYSYIGRAGGKQDVFLNMPGCEETGSIQHELMHALGFYHEQSRIDRNEYVDINWENIEIAQQSNFELYNGKTFGLPYDFESILHYKSDAFAKDITLWTIRPKPVYQKDYEIGQRKRMSKLDVKKIVYFYGCSPTDLSIPAPVPAITTTSATLRVPPTTVVPTPRSVVQESDSEDDQSDSEEVELVVPTTKPTATTIEMIPTMPTTRTTQTPKRRRTTSTATPERIPDEPVTFQSVPRVPLRSVLVSESCDSELDTSCSEVQQDIVDLVNYIRRKQNAANMMQMVWDDTFRQIAQQYTDKCDASSPFGSSDTSWSSMQMANGDGFQSWNATFKFWLHKRLRFPSTCGVSGSKEPQMIWAIINKIGCGYSPCASRGGKLFLCIYGPRLYAGQLSFGPNRCSPYLPGPGNGGPCGGCGGLNSQDCEDRLCKTLPDVSFV